MMLFVYAGNGNSIPSVDTVSGSLPVDGCSPGRGCALGVVRGAASRLVLSATGGGGAGATVDFGDFALGAGAGFSSAGRSTASGALRTSSVGPEVHPGGPFGSHKGGERGTEVVVRERRLLHVNAPVAVQGHDQSGLGLERTCLGARQADVHAALHDGRRDHENDEQHERDVHERRHVDIGVQGELAVPAQAPTASYQAGHYSLPSRAIVPMISWAKPSSSPANSPRRFTNRLYAITEGTATASPATVVTSASATPGATAPMFPDPPTAIPMKASITPNTVPSRPSKGLTDPKVASHGMNRAAPSRSAATSLASTMRSASSCVIVRALWVATAGPLSFKPPGLSSEKTWIPSRSSRL